MGIILDTILAQGVRQQEASVEAINQAVRLGLAPFAFETIYIGYDFDIDFNTYRLWIDVHGLSDGVFETKIDRDDLIDLWSVERTVSKIAEKAFQHYRYRPSLPVDDHIQLGED